MKIKFVRQYTTPVAGNQFRIYEDEDGNRVDVKIREGRESVPLLTNAEAKTEAVRRFQGRRH
jgi:hypothetical protein